jgi:hypothetical protein
MSRLLQKDKTFAVTKEYKDKVKKWLVVLSLFVSVLQFFFFVQAYDEQQIMYNYSIKFSGCK